VSDVVDDSVNGASQPPVPEGMQPVAPTPAEPPVDLSFPDAVAPMAPAAEIAVSPAPLGDGLTGELQALTAELETAPVAEPVADAAPTAEPTVESAEPAEVAEAVVAVAVTEEAAPSQDAANTTELMADEAAEPAAEGDAPEAEAPGTDAESADADAAESAEPAETTESSDSLDDIAPGTVTGPEETPHAPGPPPITSVPSWPFLAYVALWLAVAGFGIWKSMGIPAELALFDTDLYRLSVLTGLVMLAGGPLLLIVVWFASWIGRANTRKGAMFISALIKGACATLAGAIIWWGALLLMDYLRLGRLL
jgi:hypothetical protein